MLIRPPSHPQVPATAEKTGRFPGIRLRHALRERRRDIVDRTDRPAGDSRRRCQVAAAGAVRMEAKPSRTLRQPSPSSQPAMIKTKCVQSPIQPRKDGLRILVTRFRGRRLATSRYDVWMASLGPSEQLLAEFQSGDIDWAEFARRVSARAARRRRPRPPQRHDQEPRPEVHAPPAPAARQAGQRDAPVPLRRSRAALPPLRAAAGAAIEAVTRAAAARGDSFLMPPRRAPRGTESPAQRKKNRPSTWPGRFLYSANPAN